MATPIIDNFFLGTETPIDNRFLVGPNEHYTDRNSIEFKYPGLRVWDLNDDKAYVWDGIVWEDDSNVNTGQVGPGTINTVPIFTSTNSVGNSIITQSSNGVSIQGTLTSTGFSGPGTNITSINASEISQGAIGLNVVQGPNNSIIVGSGQGQSSTWTPLNNVNVGSSDRVNMGGATSQNEHFFVLSQTAGNNATLRTNNSIRYTPILGILETPVLRLSNTTTISGNQVILSIDNNNIVRRNSGMTIPFGGIIMWYSLNTPSGFVDCDGQTHTTSLGTITTPDLRQRLIFGHGNSDTVSSPDPLFVSNLNVSNKERTFDITDNTNNTITYIGIRFIMYVGI